MLADKMHIKIIKGKKYYYESKRIGKKVFSKYVGPVKPLRKKKAMKEQPVNKDEAQESTEEDFYIG